MAPIIPDEHADAGFDRGWGDADPGADIAGVAVAVKEGTNGFSPAGKVPAGEVHAVFRLHPHLLVGQAEIGRGVIRGRLGDIGTVDKLTVDKLVNERQHRILL